MQLQNYAAGQWVAGSGKRTELIDAITGGFVSCGPPLEQLT